MRRLALFSAILIGVAACAPSAVPAASVAQAVTGDASPAACTAAGGHILKVCRRQMERCVMPFPDAGKRCTDGDQCVGDCLFNGPEAKPGDPLAGACQKNNDPCGCFTPLEDGKISDRARCVD